jgi:lactate permease
MALVIATTRDRQGLGRLLASPGLTPYLVLIAAVGAQKLALAPLERLSLSPALATDRVSFTALTSPGVALLAATLFTAARELTPALLAKVALGAWRPVGAIALFMLAARLMVECGAIAALAASVGALGRDGATVAVALLGAVGGFVTGSGVTGNALFMPSAAAAGASLGTLPVLAALQNAASGHVAMASLPVAAILLAALPARTPGDDALVMRLGLALAAWHVAVATLAALAAQRLAA